jgi:hypothetical protein
MFSQISRDVPGPKIVEIAGLAAANNSYRLALEESRLRLERRAEENIQCNDQYEEKPDDQSKPEVSHSGLRHLHAQKEFVTPTKKRRFPVIPGFPFASE